MTEKEMQEAVKRLDRFIRTGCLDPSKDQDNRDDREMRHHLKSHNRLDERLAELRRGEWS